MSVSSAVSTGPEGVDKRLPGIENPAQSAAMSIDDARHGTLNGYKNLRCRCAPCSSVQSRYEKRRKWLVHQGLNPTVPAIGFQRRVQALMAIGWTQRSIAADLGIATGNLSLKMRANTVVYRATHIAMCELYERRCMKPQRGMVNERTARIAAKRGWPPPLAWDDIDNPDEKPRGWRYSPADRLETLTELDQQNLGVSAVCRRLGLSREALQRWCERNGANDLYRRLASREGVGYWSNQFVEGGVA